MPFASARPSSVPASSPTPALQAGYSWPSRRHSRRSGWPCGSSRPHHPRKAGDDDLTIAVVRRPRPDTGPQLRRSQPGRRDLDRQRPIPPTTARPRTPHACIESAIDTASAPSAKTGVHPEHAHRTSLARIWRSAERHLGDGLRLEPSGPPARVSLLDGGQLVAMFVGF